MKRIQIASLLLFGLLTFDAHAQHSHAQHSHYKGMESRDIKTLSEQDIEELRRGGGWGLALPAELNGVPGPAHLLELKDVIPLTAEQVAITEALFEQMKEAAVHAGEKLIQAERDIEKIFAERSVTEQSLLESLQAAESARTELRFIHLSQHYETLQYLSDEQIQTYNQLRGYDSPSNSACDQVPEGHDPVMYRRHMGCPDVPAPSRTEDG